MARRQRPCLVANLGILRVLDCLCSGHKHSVTLAMDNQVKLIQQRQGANATSPDLHANEVFRRLKLDSVDEETLASDLPTAHESASVR